jgi:hypothetical protein
MASIGRNDVEDGRACSGQGGLDLDKLPVEVLEQVLFDLMVIKYPGVEQPDLEQLLRALSAGDLALVAEIEANIALKSAQWSQAVIDLDGQE